MMTFHGVKTPALDIPLIELETPQGDLVDLYNDYHLESVVLRGDDLTFGFVSVSAGTPTEVRFSKVRELRVMQPKDWVPSEADQIDHLLVRPSGQRRRVTFKAGGLQYEFDCSMLTLVRS